MVNDIKIKEYNSIMDELISRGYIDGEQQSTTDTGIETKGNEK